MTATNINRLAGPQRQLVDRMTRLKFGRIEELEIRNGVPVFDPAPRVVRDIKLGGDATVYPNLSSKDFELKPQVLDLLAHLTALGDGRVECLEVKNGLPFRLVVRE